MLQLSLAILTTLTLSLVTPHTFHPRCCCCLQWVTVPLCEQSCMVWSGSLPPGTECSVVVSRYTRLDSLVVHAAAARATVRLSTAGRRSFPVAASIFWYTLPVPDDVQSAPSAFSFRQQLKTFLFHQSLYYISVLRYHGLCNSLGCFSYAKNSWLTLTLTCCTFSLDNEFGGRFRIMPTHVLCIHPRPRQLTHSTLSFSTPAFSAFP